MSNIKHQKLLAWMEFLSFSFSHIHFSFLWYYLRWLWNIIAYTGLLNDTGIAHCLIGYIKRLIFKVYRKYMVTLYRGLLIKSSNNALHQTVLNSPRPPWLHCWLVFIGSPWCSFIKHPYLQLKIMAFWSAFQATENFDIRFNYEWLK